MTLGKSDAELQLLATHTKDLTAAMQAAAAAQAMAQAQQDLKALQDENEAQRLLTGAVFGTIDAQRLAAQQAKLKAIDDAIAAATDEKLIATLKALRAQMIV